MSGFRSFSAITLFNLKSLPDRIGPSALAVISTTGVVIVLTSVLAIATGLGSAITTTGRPGRALVLGLNAELEVVSNISNEVAMRVATAPHVAHSKRGDPLVSNEVLISTSFVRKDNEGTARTAIRGISSQAVHREIRMVSGRAFVPGLHELMVGREAAAQFMGLNVGDHLALRGEDWMIVGVFATGGDAHESELMADSDTIRATYGRPGYSSILVELDTPASFDAFSRVVVEEETLPVSVVRESTYYEKQSQGLGGLLYLVSHGVAALMAVGAIFGALNSMYASVDTRAVEIATLRAIGFPRRVVVGSVLAEALLLAVLGAVIGVALAWALFSGDSISTIGSITSKSQIGFRLKVDAPIALQGMAYGCAIGLVGGLFPALHAVRLSIATTIRGS